WHSGRPRHGRQRSIARAWDDDLSHFPELTRCCDVRIGSLADICATLCSVFRSRSIRLEIDGFDHAPPFDDVGSKHRVGSFLIKVEGLKAELLETRRHFRIF